jgi:Fic family protein
VKEKMHELINWLNTQNEKIKSKDKKALHPTVLAFEFYLRYISIHPFYDGNGRTARILTNLILISYGYPPVIVKLEEKKKYYQYLADIQGYGGASDLFYEFMGGLLVHSQETIVKALTGDNSEESPRDLF